MPTKLWECWIMFWPLRMEPPSGPNLEQTLKAFAYWKVCFFYYPKNLQDSPVAPKRVTDSSNFRETTNRKIMRGCAPIKARE